MYHSLVLASIAIVSIRQINAQNLGDLPVCAQVAASAAIIQTGCAITDIACVCRGGAFLTALVQQECDETEQKATYAFASQLCAIAGVKLPTSIPALAATRAATIAETVPSHTVSSSTLSEAPISSTPQPNSNNNSAITTNTTAVIPSSEVIISASVLSSSAIMVTSSIPIGITTTLIPIETPNTTTSIPVILSTIPPQSLSIMSVLASSIQSIIDTSTATTVEATFTSTPRPLPSTITTVSKSPAVSPIPSTSTLSDKTPTPFPRSSITIPGIIPLPSSAIPSKPGANTTNSTSFTGGPSVQAYQLGSGAPTPPGRSWMGFFAAGVSGGAVALLFCAL